MSQLKNKYTSNSIVLQKLKYFCAYQERCHYEVQQKMYDLKIAKQDHGEFLAILIQEDYVNEQRYAELFVRSKFNQKSWGKILIKQKLKTKKISEYCIKKGLAQIDEDEYIKVLEKIILKKIKTLDKKWTYKNVQKLLTFCYNKGYEKSLTLTVIDRLK